MATDLCTAPWRPRLQTTQKTPIRWRPLCYHKTDPKRKFLLSLQSQFCQIMFCWGRHDWKAVMLTRNVNLTPRQSEHWLALLHLAAQDTHTLVHRKLLCWASLITLERTLAKAFLIGPCTFPPFHRPEPTVSLTVTLILSTPTFNGGF